MTDHLTLKQALDQMGVSADELKSLIESQRRKEIVDYAMAHDLSFAEAQILVELQRCQPAQPARKGKK